MELDNLQDFTYNYFSSFWFYWSDFGGKHIVNVVIVVVTKASLVIHTIHCMIFLNRFLSDECVPFQADRVFYWNLSWEDVCH